MPLTKKRYLFRYLLLFCVPILLTGSLLWANDLWYAYREITNLKSTVLDQITEEMDALSTQMQAVADKVGANGEFTEGKRGNGEDYEKISQWLTMYENLLSDDIILAYYMTGDTNIVLNQEEGVVPYRDFEDKTANAVDFSLAGFFKTLNQSSRPAVTGLFWQKDSFYAFSYTYPIVDQEARRVGTLCFLVPNTVIRSMFSRYFPESSAELYILDAGNRPLYYETGKRAKAWELSGKKGIGAVESDASEVALRAVSQQNQHSYFVVMSRDDFYSSRNTEMLLLYGFVTVLLLFSSTIAVLLARSHYANLQRLHGQNQKLEDALDERQGVICSLVLRKLIDGSRKDQQTVDYNLHCANIQFYHPLFYILVADFSVLPDEEVAMSSFFQIFERVNAVESYMRILMRTELHQAVVVINTVYDRKKLAQNLGQILPSGVPMGLSRTHEDYLHLNNAYIEAVVAVNEQMNAIVENIFIFDDEEEAACDSLISPLEYSVIQECIRNGNRELLSQRISVIFQKISALHNYPQIVQLVCCDMINLCVRMHVIFRFPLDTRTILSISDFESPQALAASINRLLFELCDTVQKQLDNTEASTKYNLIGFVQKNFCDCNLSLSLLAEKFGLSPSYISKLFKEETGQNFVSYVKQLRLSYVKKQLTETDQQVKDIIHNSGYVDVSNFTRIFKKEVGVTPLQYRQNIRRCGNPPFYMN